MLIDRRAFVAGAAMAAVVPIPQLSAHSAPATTGRVVLLIDGWNKPVDETTVDQVWIRIGLGWRTSWR
jgi:hypothetical protein